MKVAAVVMFQFPPLLEGPVPREVAPSNSSTVTLGSAVPLNVRLVVLLVMLSVLEIPVSSPPLKSGAEGAAGATVSIVMLSAQEAADTGFPATTSVALAVML